MNTSGQTRFGRLHALVHVPAHRLIFISSFTGQGRAQLADASAGGVRGLPVLLLRRLPLADTGSFIYVVPKAALTGHVRNIARANNLVSATHRGYPIAPCGWAVQLWQGTGQCIHPPLFGEPAYVSVMHLTQLVRRKLH